MEENEAAGGDMATINVLALFHGIATDYHTLCWNYADYHQAIAEIVHKNWG
jgi:hypothetical protein